MAALVPSVKIASTVNPHPAFLLIIYFLINSIFLLRRGLVWRGNKQQSIQSMEGLHHNSSVNIEVSHCLSSWTLFSWEFVCLNLTSSNHTLPLRHIRFTYLCTYPYLTVALFYRWCKIIQANNFVLWEKNCTSNYYFASFLELLH